MINTREDFNRRIKTLGNILKKNNPSAQEIRGNVIAYIPMEREREMRRLDRLRKRQREDLAHEKYGKSYDDLKEVQQAILASENNILPLAGAYLGAVGLQQLWNMGASTTGYYMADRYIAVIEDQMYYLPQINSAVIALVEDIARVPGELERIFNQHDIETHLQYIYINSKDPTPFDKRIKNVLQYWQREHSRVFGTKRNGEWIDERGKKVVGKAWKMRRKDIEGREDAFSSPSEFFAWVDRL